MQRRSRSVEVEGALRLKIETRLLGSRLHFTRRAQNWLQRAQAFGPEMAGDPSHLSSISPWGALAVLQADRDRGVGGGRGAVAPAEMGDLRHLPNSEERGTATARHLTKQT